MDLGLAGKAAVITGGSRGIGRSVAIRLADEGCSVAICGRTAGDVEQTVKDLQALGVHAAGYALDLLVAGEVERFFDQAAQDLGSVDLLVANAGGMFGGSLLESVAEDWTRNFELNVLHASRAIRASAPYMRRRDGGSCDRGIDLRLEACPQGPVRRGKGR